MDFTHLHLHSTYSFLDGYGTIEQIVNKAKELKFKSLGLTDHGSVDGLLPFYFECKKQGIKPILGEEFYVYTGKNFKEKRGTNHFTVLAKNKKGFENLCKLTTLANQQFYYYPRISLKQVADNQEGLIVLSGCSASPFFELGFDSEIIKYFKELYFEIVPLNYPEYIEKVKNIIFQIRKSGIPIVATGDVHFINQGEETIQLILKLVKFKQMWYNRQAHKLPDLFLRNTEQMEFGLGTYFPFLTKEEIKQSIENTQKISDQCDIELGEKMSLEFDTKGSNKEDYFFGKIEEGIKIRQIPKTDIYKNRLVRETKLIKEKNFIDYFLIIADIANWAKNNDIFVGSARGSSAASLVCYLLRITEVDPIRFDLLFERFLEPNRFDLPDIDIDFEDSKRDAVINYIKEKYKYVANLSAYSSYKGRICLLDIARVFNIPAKKILKLTPLVIQRSGADARASFTIEDTFKEFEYAQQLLKEYPVLKFAKSLEGQIRQKTKNAAGVVVSDRPLEKFGAILKDNSISMDKYTADKIGALKIDILGLSTLRAIHNTLKDIEKRYNKKINIYKIPLDDEKVYKLFRKNKTEGSLQFDGFAVKSVLKQMAIKEFNDLVVLNALARPGALHCGGTTEYIKRKKQSYIDYPHPSLEPILKETLGVFIYQEQVIKCLREKGGLSWEDTSELRKAMSRSLGTEFFNKYRDKFVTGAQKNGFTSQQALRTWNEQVTFGSWAFNKAHSVSYTLIGYWCMWLKVNYPLEFYTNAIAGIFSKEKRDKIVKEWRNSGGKILGIDINRSKKNAIIDSDATRMGFVDIEGFGEKSAEEIIDKQPFADAEDFHKRINHRIINKNKVAILEKIGVLSGEKMQIELFPEKKEEVLQKNLRTYCPWMFNLDFSKYRTPDMTTLNEIIGSDARRIKTVAIIREINLRDSAELSREKGYHKHPREWDKHKNEQTKFCNLLVEDEYDIIYVTINRKKYPQLKQEVWKDGGENNIVIIEGNVQQWNTKIFANNLKVVGKL